MAETTKKKEGWIKSWIRKLKESYKKTIQNPHPASDIALAVAIGVFLSFQPLFFFLIPVLLLFILIVPLLRHNKIAFFLGAFVNTTLTSIFTFPIAYDIGKVILGHGAPVTPQELTTWAKFDLVYEQLIIGCVILGIIAAAIVYFIIYYAILAYRKRKEKKKNEKKN